MIENVTAGHESILVFASRGYLPCVPGTYDRNQVPIGNVAESRRSEVMAIIKQALKKITISRRSSASEP